MTYRMLPFQWPSVTPNLDFKVIEDGAVTPDKNHPIFMKFGKKKQQQNLELDDSQMIKYKTF